MSDDPTKLKPAGAEPSYQLTLENEDEYRLVRCTGRRTLATPSSLATAISRTAIEHQRGKILIYVRESEGWLGVMDSCSIVREEFDQLRGKGIKKAAIVDRPKPEIREWFFEMVVRNRGFNIKIFEDSAIALDCLLSAKADGEIRLNLT
jgi:hypothetical protein